MKNYLFIPIFLFFVYNLSYSQPGTPDITFGTNGIVSASVTGLTDVAQSIALQSDGKMVVAGFNGNSPSMNFVLARFNSNGSFDNTNFGSGGVVTTNFNNDDDYAYTVAVQNDGKIIAGGQVTVNGKFRFGLARYNSNGSLDASFGSSGKVTTVVKGFDDEGRQIAIQNDGKIIIAGIADDGTGWSKDFTIIRYNSNGTLDNTFGTNGIVYTNIALNGTLYSDDWVYSVAIQNDGKILVGGWSNTTVGLSHPTYAMIRYNSNGSIDNTFGNSGIVITSIAGDDDRAYSIALQNDGKIILAGTSSNGSYYDFSLARYNTDGSIDNTFDNDGKVITSFGVSAYIYSVKVLCNGKIIAGGTHFDGSNYKYALACYNTDGSLDNTFGNSGLVTKTIGSFGGMGNAMVIQNDGKILIAGTSYQFGGTDFGIMRFNCLDPIVISQNKSICSGSSITIGNNTYNTAGTYIDTLTSAGGCDSIITTNLSVSQSTSSSNVQWVQTTTPPSGTVWGLASIGTDLFAGTVSGGIYYSPDNGTTWTQRNGAFPGMQVYSLITDGTNLYAGTGGGTNGGIYMSSDLGLSWTDIKPSGMSSSANVYALAIDGNFIYAGIYGGSGGIYKSSLTGISTSSWSNFNTGLINQNIRSLLIDGTNILAGTYGNGVWISPTSSANWAATTGMNSSADYIQCLVKSGNTLLAGNISGTPVLYKSTNNGLNWSTVNASVFNNLPIYSFITNGNAVYAGTEKEGVKVSYDDGNTWTTYNDGFINTQGNWYCNDMSIRSFAFIGSKIFGGSDCGVWERDLYTKICFGQSVTIGNNTYTSTGNYIDTLVAANGCDSIVTTNILVYNAIKDSVYVTPANCGSTYGSASIFPSGGTSPYTYIWNTNPAETTQTANSLSAGSYSVTVTDDMGCIDTLSIKINNIETGVCIEPPTSMTAWFSFDETEGDTIAKDIIHTNNGTPFPGNIGALNTGTGPAPGSSVSFMQPSSVVGGSLYFYGQPNQYIRVPDDPSLNFDVGNFTIDTWVFPVSSPPNIPSPILDKSSGSAMSCTGYSFYIMNGKVYIQLMDGASMISLSAPVNFMQWQHLAVVRDVNNTSQSLQLYINGVLVNSTSQTVGSLSNSADLFIGGLENSSGFCSFAPLSSYGEIGLDELEIFNRALSACELYSIWNAGGQGKCKSASICGKKFNDFNGNGIYDAGEKGIANWKISLNNPGIPDVLTDTAGNYCFNNLPKGQYIVSEVNQFGWQQTLPKSVSYTLDVTMGQQIKNIDFGNMFDSTAACVHWELSSDEHVSGVSGNIFGQDESLSSGSMPPFMSIFMPYSNGQRLWVGNSGWVAGSLDPLRYIEFNAMPASGYAMNITDISFSYNDHPLGTDYNIINFQAFYSTDGWNTSQVISSGGLIYKNTSVQAFQVSTNAAVTPGGTFSLRIYPYALQNGIGMTPTFATHKDVKICGYTTPDNSVNTKIRIAPTLQFKLYPNPASDILNIEFSHSENKTASISILNLMGQKITKKAIESGISAIDISDLQNGFYYVVLQINDKIIESKKLVIVR